MQAFRKLKYISFTYWLLKRGMKWLFLTHNINKSFWKLLALLYCLVNCFQQFLYFWLSIFYAWALLLTKKYLCLIKFVRFFCFGLFPVAGQLLVCWSQFQCKLTFFYTYKMINPQSRNFAKETSVLRQKSKMAPTAARVLAPNYSRLPRRSTCDRCHRPQSCTRDRPWRGWCPSCPCRYVARFLVLE